MKKAEKEMMDEYREISWMVLITWMLVFIIGFFFLFGIGYAIGEYVIPFISSLDRVEIERAGWFVVLFILVFWVYKIYTRIEK